MKLKLDENLSRYLKSELSSLGHDVSTAGDEGLLGHLDPEIAAAAKAEQRVVLTLDVGFANLQKYPPGSHPGIVLFRPASLGPMSTNRFIIDFISKTELDKIRECLVVVEPGKVRVRRPHE